MRMNLFHSLAISQVPDVNHLVCWAGAKNAFVCWMPDSLVDYTVVLKWGLWACLRSCTIPNLERLIHTARENRCFIQVVPLNALYLCLMPLEYSNRLRLTHLPQLHGFVTTSRQNLPLITLTKTRIKTTIRRLKRLQLLQSFCWIQLEYFDGTCSHDTEILAWGND